MMFPAIPRRRAFLIAAASLAGTGAWAQPAPWPDRPIRLVIPNPPGGPSDIVGRLLADAMRESLGQPLSVDNRPGAAGLIGTAAVVNAAPDGYTVLVTSRSNHVMAPLVQTATSVDPQRDLLPVGLALRAVGVFATNGQTRYRSLRELVAAARARPGTLNYGSASVGAANHIAMEQFKALLGVNLVHVPYRGSGPLITGLMGNEVQLALLDLASSQSAMQAGSLVPLAQTGTHRLPALPDVPTLAQAGVPAYDASFWIGLAVTRGTPPDIVRRLNAAMNTALAQTRIKAYAQANGWELVGGSPQVLADTVAADWKALPGIVQGLGLKGG